MTAEIAVMNKGGIALASDSAVSMQSGRGYKIFNTTEKLFRLSEDAPVAVMIYGNSQFMGVPWETLLKLYRKKLGSTLYKTLKEYAEDLLRFLRDESKLFPASEKEKYVLCVVKGRLREIHDRIVSEIGVSGPSGQVDLAGITKKCIEAFVSTVEASEFLPDLPADFENQVTALYEAKIADEIQKVLKKFAADANLQKALKNSFLRLLSKKRFFDVSGIVVSGYGDEDIFPSLVCYEIEGMAADGFVKFYVHTEASVGFKNDASVISFAQGEMVSTFMEGTHPKVAQFLRKYLTRVFTDFGKTVLAMPELKGKGKNASAQQKLEKASAEILKKCFEEIKTYTLKEHVSPVMQALGGLPKEELATMAETLVNLTSFKRKVSTDAETVGGPIDVAVISKADGLVWVKRKRYFKSDLNPSP